MAFEVSIIGGAQRLQTQRDQSTELSRVQQREIDLRRARALDLQNQNRRLEAQVKADTVASDLKNERIQAENARQLANAQQFQDVRDRAIADRLADKRLDLSVAEQNRFYNNQRALEADKQAADNARAPLTSTAPPEPTIQDVTTSPSTSPASYAQLLTERNTRLADQAQADRLFAATQKQDYTRSVNSIEALRSDPTSLPADPSRGSVVDFSA